MHIPDGYLSPSTCVALYAAASANWYAALKRIKRVMAGRTIPLISVFAAFCFVVMMFNVPLPGGTTGHATGVAVAAIVLGPWGSILAMSIALAIQALFFGDGGITTLGANCFNMAVVGSFVAYGIYRVIAARAELSSRRRVIAAAIAGYVAINASAFIAALEFGIQPVLFHDASGTPLYAPYPLHIAIPAMMIGHLTFAGLAEGVISAGMVAYLQRANAALLGGAKASSNPQLVPDAAPGSLWWAVALLMMLTPLGILAAGTAWGEWTSADLSNPRSPAVVRASSESHSPPGFVPAGLERLSRMWTAPFPSYAPRFIKSAAFGYWLSAIFGVGVCALLFLATNAAVRKRRESQA